MAAELRFILATLGALLLAGIWWWGTRRSRQAAGNAELRESTMNAPVAAGRPPTVVGDEPDPAEPRERETASDWDVSPLDPLSIRTTQFEPVELGELSITARPDPLEETLDLGITDHRPAPRAASPLAAAEAAPARVAEPLPAETQHIVSIRVCARGEMRWSGSDLMSALENHGLAHGRYNVFHRKHSDGRTLFCAASLVEPGAFNLSKMPQEEFRGLTLFAILPGPLEPLLTLDAVIETAGGLASALHGTLQDAHGDPLSMQRAEALRRDVARFQAQLTAQ